MHSIQRELALTIERLRARGERKLPPERVLADELGTSRGTLRNELARLAARGVIVQRLGRGGGSFIEDVAVEAYLEPVAEPPLVVTRSLDAVVGVPTFLTDQGYEPSTRILRTEERPAQPEDRRRLALDDDGRVAVIQRVRSADGVPLSLEEMTLPVDLFPGLLDRELRSIYELMRTAYGTEVSRAEETIGVGAASAAAAYLLDTDPGAPLFDIRRTAYDQRGRPVEVSRDLFRADITRLTVTERRDP